MAAMLGMSVSAAGNSAGVVTEDGITSVSVSKTVTTDGNTYAPATTFTFNVQNGAEGTYQGDTVQAGVTGGLTASQGAAFGPTIQTEVDSSYTASGSLAVNASAFSSPGIYHYVVSEANGGYEGISYDTAQYDVYLYVYNRSQSGTTNDLYVGNVVSVKGDQKADLAFTNDYGAGKDNDSTHDVKITKSITGNMADLTDDFHFDITINGAAGEYYKVVTNIDGTQTTTQMVSGTPATFTLGNGDSVQIYGLSEGDTYTVTEREAGQNGYTTAISGSSTTDNKTTSGTLDKDGTAITYTNSKSAGAATGIIMNIAPYIILVAVAAAAAVLFLRRRNSREF